MSPLVGDLVWLRTSGGRPARATVLAVANGCVDQAGASSRTLYLSAFRAALVAPEASRG